MARVAVSIAALFLITFALPSFAESKKLSPSLSPRYSSSKDKVRFVLDLPSEVAFADTSTPTAVIVTISLPDNTTLAPIKLKDALVKKVTLTGNGNGQVVLTIHLAKARKCRIFTLPGKDKKQFRLVIDILKRFVAEEHQSLSSAAEYIRLERQAGNRHLIAHVISVKATDPKVRFQVVVAGNNGESISSMVKRTKADYGINGGFFLTRVRPVGVLKSGNQLYSMPIWNRTALAFPAAGMPVFGNPGGSWAVTIADDQLTLPDWMDSINSATPPAARVISGGSIFRVPENPHGVTAIIRAGAVIALLGGQPSSPDAIAAELSPPTPAIPDEQPPPTHDIQVQSSPPPDIPGGQSFPTAAVSAGQLSPPAPVPGSPMSLEPDDFALYLLGDIAKELAEKLVRGTAVTIKPVVTPPWEEYPNIVGAGPRLLAGGKLMITGKQERFQSDIISGSAARSAIGITRDERVILIAVEAPGPYGGGATLEELAALLKKFGAVDAMNLDGGGSSSLAIGDKILKYPPTSWERPVASGILVIDDNREKKPMVAAKK